MIYLDNAATTYPKPRSVYEATLSYMRTCGGNPGRGSHPLSLAAAETVFECRSLISSLFGLDSPENTVFTLNTTYALNTVIKGVLRNGDHVLISDLEHNSVYRPIYRLAQEGRIKYGIFRSFAGAPHTDYDIINDILSRLNMRTRMIVCTHASNICSEVLPIKKIGELCRKRGIFFCVDAAQSAGHIPIDLKEINADALCIPAHKGLYGPQGCGIILLRSEAVLKTLAEGGNGINSLEGAMPEVSPERYEAGTLPMPAIAGLCAGVREVAELTPERIHAHECALFRYAKERLSQIEGVSIYAPQAEGSVLLFDLDGIMPDALGERLGNGGICVRSGYHCAALAHGALKTKTGGAVRASFGIYNTFEDIDALCDAVSMARQ